MKEETAPAEIGAPASPLRLVARKPRRKRGAESVALGVARGLSVAQAAREAGVSSRWAFEMLRDPEIRARIEELRRDSLGVASGKLAGATGAAADTLADLLKSASETVRLSAARAVLEQAVRVRELVELESRIEALERAADPRNPAEGGGE